MVSVDISHPGGEVNLGIQQMKSIFIQSHLSKSFVTS